MKFNYKHTIGASCLGYVTQAMINNFAPLLFLVFQKTYHIPLEQITLLITLNFLIQLLVDLLSARFVDRIGYRRSVVMGHFFSACGLVGLAILPSLLPVPFYGLLLAVVLYAIGGGIIEVLVSPIVEACPTENKSGIMSLLHSFYSWGAVAVIVISTLFLSIFGEDSWKVLACIWAVLPAANGCFFLKVPIATLVEDGEGMPVRKLFSKGTFWLLLVMMICSGASEQAMSQWASTFAESGLGVSKAIGDLAGPCLFAICMGTARVLYARFSHKVDLLSFILGSSVLCVGAYLLTVFAQTPVLSFLGCGLCGFSVGILWPGIFSLASPAFPKGGTAMFALLALGGDFGCSFGPTVVGFVSGAWNDQLKYGLLAAISFPILLILCILGLKFGKTTQKKLT